LKTELQMFRKIIQYVMQLFTLCWERQTWTVFRALG